ncbi:hypothetical protein ACYPKM_02275 [Pseudomonas aeruginosa]
MSTANKTPMVIRDKGEPTFSHAPYDIKLLGIPCGDKLIANPYLDREGKNPVDPVTYYGFLPTSRKSEGFKGLSLVLDNGEQLLLTTIELTEAPECIEDATICRLDRSGQMIANCDVMDIPQQ